MHRLIGILKLKSSKDSGRFKVISDYYNHIRLYVILASVVIAWLLTKLDPLYIWLLLPVGVISVAYVLPVFPKGRRIRDFNYIKILLIGFVWAYVSCLPLLMNGVDNNDYLLQLSEKIIFIIAITLPFDLRDMSIDKAAGLKTLPLQLGTKKSYLLIYALLAIGCLLLAFIPQFTVVKMLLCIAIYLISGVIIFLSSRQTSDWFYSGLVDGTLIIRGLILLAVFIV